MGRRDVWRSVLGAVLLLAACSDDRDPYSGPEAHSPDEVLALLREAGLPCGDVPDPVGHGLDDPGPSSPRPPARLTPDKCVLFGTEVQIHTFANEDEQVAYLDQPVSCGNAYDRDQRPVVVGRGWILAVISLTGTNDIAPIAEALGTEAYDRCGEAR